MEWIITRAFDVDYSIFALVAVLVLRSKRHGGGNVPGRFDFADFKDRELSKRGVFDRIYPYLLRDLAPKRPDQVWCADITYVRMRRGFLSLVAIMD